MASNLKQHLKVCELSLADMVLGCRQVGAGLGFLASRAVVHRDVAARNVLVATGDGGVWKVADLGIARDVADDVYMARPGVMVPIKWTAPEALERCIFSSASDVWSFGILMVEVMTGGEDPYPGMSNSEVRASLARGYRMPCPSPLTHHSLTTHSPLTHHSLTTHSLTHYSLTHHPSPPTHHSLTHYYSPLLTTHSPPTHHPSPPTHHSLTTHSLTTHSLTTYSLTTYSPPLTTTHHSPLTTHSPLTHSLTHSLIHSLTNHSPLTYPLTHHSLTTYSPLTTHSPPTHHSLTTHHPLTTYSPPPLTTRHE
ncbi:uncharacterized protein LOC142907393 [Petromyzon marinus]|uniref:uncharacterized protein LOC142907393 n=1 Tax=Petromyzon marinus TaxID=7757 RepID=UPI003F70BB03